MGAKGSFQAVQAMACEAVAVFDREEDLQLALGRFRRFGFERSVLSVFPHPKLAGECRDCFPRFQPIGGGELTDMESIGTAQGALIAGPLYLFACCAMFGVASHGASLAAIATMGVLGGAAGGALGAYLAHLFARRRRRRAANRHNRGYLFLRVRIRDREHENRAREILAGYPARDIHLHGAQSPAAGEP